MRTIPLTYLAFLLLLFGTSCRQPDDGVSRPDPAPTVTASPIIGLTLETRAPPTVPVVSFTPKPTPLPAPLPTPTPRVHVVETGDTILGMAIQYGVDTDEIMSLNPGVRPEALQIGQEIVLPPPPTPGPVDALADGPPANVAVRSATVYRAVADSLWVIGDVVNEESQAVENVQVALRVPLSDGGTAEARVWVLPGVVPAGERAPFGMLFRGVGSAAGAAQTAVVGGRVVTSLGSRYLDLVTEETVTRIDDGRVLLEGRIVNQGERTPTRLIVVATAYDELERVSGYRLLVLEGDVAPGQDKSFELSMALPGGNADEILTVVLGLVESES
ncbi:MAG: LysM domain-containing protein [Candidatus Promineifilaceae bacterium]|nr:LysM domain-containing protein [Candidatus Promineifilaceae bacterium]